MQRSRSVVPTSPSRLSNPQVRPRRRTFARFLGSNSISRFGSSCGNRLSLSFPTFTFGFALWLVFGRSWPSGLFGSSPPDSRQRTALRAGQQPRERTIARLVWRRREVSFRCFCLTKLAPARKLMVSRLFRCLLRGVGRRKASQTGELPSRGGPGY